MKTIWFVYPYGSFPDENSQETRYIRFGRRLSEKYNCTWWAANFSNCSKEFRDGRNEIEVQKNLRIRTIPTTAYTKNISFRRVLFEVNYARNLKRVIKKENKPDLIITSGTGMMTAFRPIWPYVKREKVKAIFDIMDVYGIDRYIKRHHLLLYPFVSIIFWINSFSEKGFYKHVVGVIGLGRKQLQIARERTGNRSIPSCLVYNSIFVDDFREKMREECIFPLPQKQKDWIWCVYAGNLGPSYDIPAVIDCAKRCKEEGKKILFIVAGYGDYETACQKEKNESFVFLGHVDKRLLPSLYAQCDVGLCTYGDFSTVDMPDKFYDYTAAGLAIVNSLTGEVKEHIEEGKLGVQYTAGDSNELYQQICRFEDKSFLEKCKKNSWEKAEEYDLGGQLDSLQQFVDKILEHSSKS